MALAPTNPICPADEPASSASKDRREEARQELDAALRLDPLDPATLVDLGELELQSGRIDAAQGGRERRCGIA